MRGAVCFGWFGFKWGLVVCFDGCLNSENGPFWFVFFLPRTTFLNLKFIVVCFKINKILYSTNGRQYLYSIVKFLS